MFFSGIFTTTSGIGTAVPAVVVCTRCRARVYTCTPPGVHMYVYIYTCTSGVHIIHTRVRTPQQLHTAKPVVSSSVVQY